MLRAFSLITLLAACGGGGAGGNGPVAFDDLLADVTAAGVTPAAQLPTEGSISYVGNMQLDLPIGPSGAVTSYQGRLEANVDFDNAGSPLSGNVGAFSAPQEALSGQLQISDGFLDPDADPNDDYQFGATLSGALSDGATDFLIVGDIAGDFYGRAADAVAGVVFGTVSDGSGLDRFDGEFAAVSR